MRTWTDLLRACRTNPVDAAILLAGAAICILALETAVFAVEAYMGRDDDVLIESEVRTK